VYAKYGGVSLKEWPPNIKKGLGIMICLIRLKRFVKKLHWILLLRVQEYEQMLAYVIFLRIHHTKLYI